MNAGREEQALATAEEAVVGETVNAGRERQAVPNWTRAGLYTQPCNVAHPPGTNLASSPATGDAAICLSRIAAFSAAASAAADAPRSRARA